MFAQAIVKHIGILMRTALQATKIWSLDLACYMLGAIRFSIWFRNRRDKSPEGNKQPFSKHSPVHARKVSQTNALVDRAETHFADGGVHNTLIGGFHASALSTGQG